MSATRIKRRRGSGLRCERLETRQLLATIELTPVADNTIYDDGVGQTSNGAGDFLFAGVTQQNSARRGLLRFDVAGNIPQGATINSAELQLTASRGQGGPIQVAVHRLVSDWGEGASDAPGAEGSGTTAEAGDATWLHAFSPQTNWTTEGGDFAASASSQTTVDNVDDYIWSGSGLLADVDHWLANPAEDFGWIVVADESQLGAAKRFNARENGDGNTTPKLTIDFTEPTTGGPTAIIASRQAAPAGVAGAGVAVFTVENPTGTQNTLSVSDQRFVFDGNVLRVGAAGIDATDQPLALDVTATDENQDQLTETFEFNFLAVTTPFHNPAERNDVNADAEVTPRDALQVINHLNANPQDPSLPAGPSDQPPFLNTSGDDLITPQDALFVINFLNAQSTQARALLLVPEGEQDSVETNGASRAPSQPDLLSSSDCDAADECLRQIVDWTLTNQQLRKF